MSGAHVAAGLDRLAALATASKSLAPLMARIAQGYVATLEAGGTLFFCGNGGSAADAQHLATEYVVRYGRNRRALAAVALTTDTSLLTAAGNDLGFEHIFSRQVEALCRPGDLLVLHSTSGRSRNLIEAARAARARQVRTVAFLGRDGGALAGEVDEAVVVPSDDTAEIQVLHLVLEHLAVELVEAALLGPP